MSNFININPDIRELTLQHGIEYPSDEELIMMILGSGARGITIEKLSERVMNCINHSHPKDLVSNLCKIKGMGNGRALAVASSLELGRRMNNHKAVLLKRPRDVLPFVQRYSMENKEHFLCITLNGGHEILQLRVISVGTVNQTLVHPRDIYSDAVKDNAAAIVVCHNHPSGNCQPSQADIELTHRIQAASDLLGIPLLDHIIFSSSSYFSFIENNLLFTDET